METDINNYNGGMDRYGTANTWCVENYVGVGRIAFPISNFFNYYFNIFRFKFTLDTINNALMTLFFFHIVSARWKFGPSAMSVIVEFSLIWTTDY